MIVLIHVRDTLMVLLSFNIESYHARFVHAIDLIFTGNASLASAKPMQRSRFKPGDSRPQWFRAISDEDLPLPPASSSGFGTPNASDANTI